MFSETRQCQNCKTDFVIEPEDFHFYEKIKVPAPTFCPECRMIRRFVFRNEHILFRRKESVTGKDIFSTYPAETPFPVYENEYWWSDQLDPFIYGREYDFSRPFFEQVKELYHAVPWQSRNTANVINSEYANNLANAKNCYLCFNLDFAEDSAYLNDAYRNKNCFDITDSLGGEFNYDSIAVEKCYRTFFSYSCNESRTVWFSRDCTNCSDCFGCTNLRNKQYYIFNRSYQKEAYVEELKKFNLGSYAAHASLTKRVKNIWMVAPYKFMLGWHNVAVTGDWIANSKNVKDSFSVVGGENVRYAQLAPAGNTKDTYDYTIWGDNAEQVYEAMETGWNARQVKFSINCWPAVEEIEYSINCHSSSYLFGCVGLQKKSYCVFNKQYSKEEYFALHEKIIRHMSDMPYSDAMGRIYRYGEFFPPEFSPFAYNETIAQDYFPLTKEAAIAKGYTWRDPEVREYQTTIDATDLPDHIRDVPASILKETIRCLSCAKAYRIIQMELDFLRQMSLPLPRLCPDCRFFERIKHRNKPRFYDRQCQCTGKKSENNMYENTDMHFHGSDHCPGQFQTSYAPDRPEIVYCEQCYNVEVT